MGNSPTPSWTVSSETVQVAMPGDSTVPVGRNQSVSRARIGTIGDRVSTLLTNVGLAPVRSGRSRLSADQPIWGSLVNRP